MPITITLSDELSERVAEGAERKQQNIVEFVEAMLDAALNQNLFKLEQVEHISNEDNDPEMAAYIRMHPSLSKRLLGAYVAIYQGELIDYDLDHSALYARIDERFPDDYVWISKVEEEPIKMLRFPSPRFEPGKPM